jgi:Predicted dehydrogenases and related proteins
MMSSKSVYNVAIVGMSFGVEFIPIYQRHPNANLVAICQRNQQNLERLGKIWGISKLYTDFGELLKDKDIDIVHINTPPNLHADMCVAALKAGKHVGCTIPMALTVEDCYRIVKAQEESGKQYMMMETVVYSREYLYLKQLYKNGELGKLQFLRSSHQQDMMAWPEYWYGFPPMLNATHAVSPVLSIGDNQAEYVSCMGSGTIDESMHANYGCPFCIETTHIKFRDSDLGAEVTRSLFSVARQYRESFDVYASQKSFEWTQIEGQSHIMHTGETPAKVEIPDFAHLLPTEIAEFTQKGVYDKADNQHLSFTQGGGHGGSHPHLVHEFLSALIEEREPYPNAARAANITCSGILSNQSALKRGDKIYLPDWTFSK